MVTVLLTGQKKKRYCKTFRFKLLLNISLKHTVAEEITLSATAVSLLQATPFSFSRHSQQSNLFFLAAFYQLCTAVAQLTATAPLTRKKGYGCFFFHFHLKRGKTAKNAATAMSTATAVSCVSPKGCAETLAPRRHGRRMRGALPPLTAVSGLGGARRTAPPASPRAPRMVGSGSLTRNPGRQFCVARSARSLSGHDVPTCVRRACLFCFGTRQSVCTYTV